MHDIREGMTVRTPEGEKLGKVAKTMGDEFIIEKGLLFKHDYRARADRIMEVRDDEIIYQPLAADDRAANANVAAPPKESATSATSRDEIRVPLAEEEIEVQKYATQKGGVRISKEVVTEEKQVTVPVTREEISVERVPAEGRTPAEASFQKEEITVPIVEEEIAVTKRPVVREEVRVRKEQVQEQRAASAEVRREEAEVEDLRKTDRPKTTDTVGGMRAPGRNDDDLKR